MTQQNARKKYKLLVKYLTNTGKTASTRPNSHQHEVPLRHFKGFKGATGLKKAYEFVNIKKKGLIAWAAIVEDTGGFGPKVAEFTADNGWNNQV